jgi:hypothetical protein
VAVNDALSQSPPALVQTSTPTSQSSTGLAFDEEAKLVYGVILSLRNMIRKLSGRYEPAHCFPRRHLNYDAEMNNLSTIVPPHTNFMSTRHFQATNSSFSVTPTLIPFDSFCAKSMLVLSLNTSCGIPLSEWIHGSMVWITSIFVLA